MRSLYAILIILLVSAITDAQNLPGSVRLDGPTSAYVGQTKHYTITFKNSSGQDIPAPVNVENAEWSWVPSGGPATNQTVNSVDVKWGAAGTFRFDYTWETIGVFVQDHIMVTVTEVPNIHTQFTFGYNCENTVVHRTSDPPDGVEWVWTTSDTNTRPPFILGTGESVTRTTEVQIYLRPRIAGTSIYGTAVAVPLFGVYAMPSVPSVAHPVIRWGTGSATISVDPVPGAEDYRWYTADGSLVSQTSNFLTIENLSINTTYYVSTTHGPCESGRLAVTAGIQPLPVVSGDCGTSLALNQPVILATTEAYDTYLWNNSATGEQGTGPTFTVNSPGTITVTATKAGVTGFGTSAPFGTTQGLGGQQNINYVTSNVIQREGVAEGGESLLDAQSLSQAVQYFDGLGRPIQSVVTQGSPLGKDVVQPFVYDGMGREFRQYLPVVVCTTDGWYKPTLINSSTGAYTGLAAHFYGRQNDKIADDAKPYAETVFEKSSLNRKLEQGAPGELWQPEPDVTWDIYNSPSPDNRSIKSAYQFNAINEVLMWTFSYPADHPQGTLNSGASGVPAYYPARQLQKILTKDEHNHQVIEYVDKSGHTILKKVETLEGGVTVYAETYYIYDDFGNLVTVLPPEATKRIKTIFSLQP
jgi:hypothetical protein